MDRISRRKVIDVPLDGIEYQNKPSIHQIPLGKRQLIYLLRDELMLGNPKRPQNRLLPDVWPVQQGGQCIDDDQGHDPFDRTRDDTKRQGVRVVFFPGLHVEGEESYDPEPLALAWSFFIPTRQKTQQ